MELLLAKDGVDPDSKGDSGQTPLSLVLVCYALWVFFVVRVRSVTLEDGCGLPSDHSCISRFFVFL